jgi:hypothetical protein
VSRRFHADVSRPAPRYVRPSRASPRPTRACPRRPANDRSATGYDQDAWAERLHSVDAPPGESLEEFEIVRRGNLRLLEAATPADLERAGVHIERGEESVGHMVRLYAGHDLLHLRQIERIRGAVSSG